jgi:hypothetical protein
MLITYDDKTQKPIYPPFLPHGEKYHHAVFHDECAFHCNDQISTQWLLDEQQAIRKKSRGRLINVSDFVIESQGRLALDAEQLTQQAALPATERLQFTDARHITYPGKNGPDPYWTMDLLVQQVGCNVCSGMES